MTVQEVIKAVMRGSGYTQIEIAERAGFKSQGSISQFLQGKSMRVDSLLTVLNACGDYDLIVRDRSGKGQSYRISNEEGIDVVDAAPGPAPDVTNYEEIARRVVIEELKLRGL